MLVHRSIQERVVESIVEGARNLKIGDPLDPATQQGALISAAHRDKGAFCVERAREEGGKVLCGGRPPAELPERCEQGFFYEPTVITGLDMDAMTNTEEIFGPVVVAEPFTDEAEAISSANSTEYGLAASVWTRDLTQARRVSESLETGMVWVNTWLHRHLRMNI